MAVLAEFESAPSGTVRRTSPGANWIDASVGDKLEDGHESNNTLSNDYQIGLKSRAEIRFEAITQITLNNVIGTVKYLNSNDDWVPVTSDGQFDAEAVGTGLGGSVSVVCAGKGDYRPPAWT